jgi:hypothetical protein
VLVFVFIGGGSKGTPTNGGNLCREFVVLAGLGPLKNFLQGLSQQVAFRHRYLLEIFVDDLETLLLRFSLLDRFNQKLTLAQQVWLDR